MTELHPITPPPEFIEEWIELSRPRKDRSPNPNVLATYAARWGADQELEACCEWLSFQKLAKHERMVSYLRAVRRPKPPSLKEQALEELELLRGDAYNHGLGFDAPAIRRALESLPS